MKIVTLNGKYILRSTKKGSFAFIESNAIKQNVHKNKYILLL